MAANPSTIARPMGVRPARRPAENAKPESPGRGFGRHAATLGYGIAAVAVIIGWLGRHERHILAESGLGYWLGITGASMMGLLLLYPVRKHVRMLHRFGSTKSWFQIHIFLGVLGPILILYHSNFSLGSLNSRVALFSTLLVAISGLAGRYLYAQVHLSLSGSRANLKQLVERARLTADQKHYTSAFVPNLLERMSRIDRKVLEPPNSLIVSAVLPMYLGVRTRWARFWLSRYTRRQLRLQARDNPQIAAQRAALERVLCRFIDEHLRRVRQVATFGFYERMFSFWHLFHLPIFYILVVATLVHILAVHMY